MHRKPIPIAILVLVENKSCSPFLYQIIVAGDDLLVGTAPSPLFLCSFYVFFVLISLLLNNNPGTPIKKISGDEGINTKMPLLKWLNHQNGSNWKAFLGGFFLINALQDFSDFIPCLYLDWIAFLNLLFQKHPTKLFAYSEFQLKVSVVNLSSRL